jgi:hypothetical protein
MALLAADADAARDDGLLELSDVCRALDLGDPKSSQQLLSRIVSAVEEGA